MPTNELFSAEELCEGISPGGANRWQIPQEYPDLSSAKIISLDLENKDPGLKEKGPGCPRNDGFIAGISVATDDGYRGYFPMRHEIGPNLDPEITLRWARDVLSNPRQEKIGSNIIYDLEWLAHEGVPVAGEFHDVQYAEPLLNENRFKYGLEVLAHDYLGEGKVTYDLDRWLSAAFGGPPTHEAQAKNIWRAPSYVVGPYAIGDVDLPLRIFTLQKSRLEAEGLWDLYRLECSLIPMLLAMRRRGVRVDVKRAEQLHDELIKREKEDMAQLRRLCGPAVNPNAPETFAAALRREGLTFPMTPSTNKPSITKEWLEACPHPIALLVSRLRKWSKLRGTFIDGYIINSNVNGRIYGQFHPLRSDEGGTVSGRFSSSKPNLENIPERDETAVEFDEEEWKLGHLIRSCFLPDEGEEFCVDDYSQVEYRGIVHYGRGPSAEKCRRMYIEDPTTDFHSLVMEWTGLGRKPTKTINFGKSYGMKAATAATRMKCTLAEAEAFLAKYDAELPFIEDLLQWACGIAKTRGYVKTILGRKARFDLWESTNWGASKKDGSMSYEKAVEKYGQHSVVRAKCYTALNRIVQGSCADIFKSALSVAWKAGVFDPKALGAPLNLVHDETDTSNRGDKIAEEAHAELINIMKTNITLSVPLLVDSERGPNWGEVK